MRVRDRRYVDLDFAANFDRHFARSKYAQRKFQVKHTDVSNVAATIGRHR